MPGRKSAGHQARARGAGPRGLAVGALEDDGVAREGVDRRRLAPGSIGSQGVRAQGVDHDQHDIRPIGQGRRNRLVVGKAVAGIAADGDQRHRAGHRREAAAHAEVRREAERARVARTDRAPDEGPDRRDDQHTDRQTEQGGQGDTPLLKDHLVHLVARDEQRERGPAGRTAEPPSHPRPNLGR